MVMRFQKILEAASDRHNEVRLEVRFYKAKLEKVRSMLLPVNPEELMVASKFIAKIKNNHIGETIPNKQLRNKVLRETNLRKSDVDILLELIR